MTRTRVWQFAFGGLLALLIDRIQFPRKTRFVLGYLGLLSIVLVGFVIDGAQHFPGPLALWPLLGFACILLAAPGHHDQEAEPRSAPHLMSNRFFAWIGDHAYGLYLWHWPLLIFYLTVRDREAVGIRGAAVIFVVALLLAMVMYRFVEKPLDRLGKERRGRRLDWTSLVAGLTVMAVGASVAFVQMPQSGDRLANAMEINVDTHPGALSVSDDLPVLDAEPIPELTELHLRVPEYTVRGCQQQGGNEPGSDEVLICDDLNAPEHPTARVVLAGGSHAGHWEDAVRSLGRAYGWEVLVAVKSGCVFQDKNADDADLCQVWNENFIDWVGENDVDLVMTSGTRVLENGETIYEGANTRWQEISDQGIDLLLLRGTPRPRDAGAKCLQEERPLEECGVTAGNVALTNPLSDMQLPDRAETIDLNPDICPALDQGEDTWCPALVGNVYVWRDGSHLSREYVTTLAPSLEREMHEVLPQYLE